MEFQSIDHVKTNNWDDVRMALLTKIGTNQMIPIKLVSFNNNQVSHKKIVKLINVHNWKFDPYYTQDPLTTFCIQPYYSSSSTESRLDKIFPNSIASQIGLYIGDIILKINDYSIENWPYLITLLCNKFNNTIRLIIKRKSKTFSVDLTPKWKYQLWQNREFFFGALPYHLPLDNNFKNLEKDKNPFTAFFKAEKNTWQLSKLTFRIFKKVIRGKLSLYTLSSPISIAQGAIISAQNGIVPYLMFLALMSINLCIINLFPLPILDGGHLLLILLEIIIGQSISNQFKEISFNISTILLILVMIFTILNDGSRFLINFTY